MNCKNKVTPSVTTSNVILTPAEAITKSDKEKICFSLTAAIPDGGAALPVVIVINGANASIYNKYGNPVMGKDLKYCACKCFKGFVGITDGVTHVSLNNYPVTWNCSGVCNTGV